MREDSLDEFSPPAQLGCSAPTATTDLTFEALAEIVQRDVGEINKVDSRKRGGYVFHFRKQEGSLSGKFQVSRTRNEYPTDPEGVLFSQKPASIVVTLKDDTQIEVAVEWDEASSSCKTKIGGVPCELWQISEKALADFFFNG